MSDPIDITIGANIRARRHLCGMSQEKLAAALGVTFQQIQKYEKGTNRVSGSMLYRAAQALNCMPGDLFPAIEVDGVGTRPANWMDQARLLDSRKPGFFGRLISLPKQALDGIDNVARAVLDKSPSTGFEQDMILPEGVFAHAASDGYDPARHIGGKAAA